MRTLKSVVRAAPVEDLYGTRIPRRWVTMYADNPMVGPSRGSDPLNGFGLKDQKTGPRMTRVPELTPWSSRALAYDHGCDTENDGGLVVAERVSGVSLAVVPPHPRVRVEPSRGLAANGGPSRLPASIEVAASRSRAYNPMSIAGQKIIG